MQSLAAINGEAWSLGFGDNDFLGWTITLTYCIAAALCIWAWRGESSLPWRSRVSARPGVWSGMAVLLVLLGINKQLDLQLWIVPTTKMLIRELGLWPSRETIGWIFGASLLIIGLASARALIRYVGRTRPRYQLSFVGLTYLSVFVAARAGSFLPGLGEITTRHLQAMHLCLELGSLIMIGASAAQAVGFVYHRARADRQTAIAESGGMIVKKERRRSQRIEMPEASRAAA